MLLTASLRGVGRASRVLPEVVSAVLLPLDAFSEPNQHRSHGTSHAYDSMRNRAGSNRMRRTVSLEPLFDCLWVSLVSP